MKTHIKFYFGFWRVQIAGCTAFSTPSFKEACYVADVLNRHRF